MKREAGIALMMVISAIMLISMIVLEFVFSSNVNYRLAVNEKERLQAYYLAESAVNLMKVELKLDKQIKSAISSSPIAQNIAIDLSQPFCQQLPFSTALLRAFFGGGEASLFKGEGATEGATSAGEEEKKSTSATIIESESAQEFLSFEGDFEGSCADESGKFNINVFANLDPTQQALSGVNPYDLNKLALANFLKSERFKKIFQGVEPKKIEEAVGNIADWTDKNDLINDFGNVGHGPEDGLYKGESDVHPKNVKFLSLDEIHQVAGVDDNWFMPIEDMFTVYGDGRVNVCLATDDVTWTLILTYAGQNPNIPVLDPKNKEVKKKLIDTIRFSCTGVQAQVAKIAADLDVALGIGGAAITQQTSMQGAAVASGGFANFITTEPRYYSLKLTGQVGDTMVNIKTVLDTKDQDPKRWKTLYYKVY